MALAAKCGLSQSVNRPLAVSQRVRSGSENTAACQFADRGRNSFLISADGDARRYAKGRGSELALYAQREHRAGVLEIIQLGIVRNGRTAGALPFHGMSEISDAAIKR